MTKIMLFEKVPEPEKPTCYWIRYLLWTVIAIHLSLFVVIFVRSCFFPDQNDGLMVILKNSWGNVQDDAIQEDNKTTVSFVYKELQGSCKEGWVFNQATTACYKVGKWKTFADAESDCRSKNSHLVSIHSDDEGYFIDYMFSIMHDPGLVQVWIGTRRKLNNRTHWENVDKTSVDYTNWKAGEPNDVDSKEDCVHISLNVRNNSLKGPANDMTAKWNDIKCDAMFDYVCKSPSP